MKKSLFLTVMLTAAFAICAQDTVRYPDHWYGYTQRDALWEYVGQQPGMSSDSVINSHYYERSWMLHDGVRDCFSTYYMYDGGMLRFFEPKTTTRVYGIAVTMDEVDFDTMNARLGLYFGVRLQPTIPHIHYYRGSCDSVVEIPMANPPLMKQCVFEYDYSLPTPWSRYSNCYEFYFDQPLDVNLGDSILYGIQLCGYNFHKVVVGRDTSRSQEIWYTNGAPRQEGNIYLNAGCWDRAWNYLYQNAPYFEMPGYENAYWYDCYWGGIFPIVSPRCTAPKGLRILHSEDRLDTVLWRGDPESDVFQVSLTVYPASPDLGTIYTVADTSLVLQPYETDSVRIAYVRKMCTFEFDSHTDTVWGDWAGPVVIVGDTTGLGGGDTTSHGGDTTGIATADLQQISITPNPATGTVTVHSAEQMTEIEVVDIVGASVLRQQTSGLVARLDVKALPRGTYIVRIHTPMGVTARKLILQ